MSISAHRRGERGTSYVIAAHPGGFEKGKKGDVVHPHTHP